MFQENEYPINPNIIGYSAYFNSHGDCLEKGMVDFLQKPAKKSEILEKI